jgi:hypothetical protein
LSGRLLVTVRGNTLTLIARSASVRKIPQVADLAADLLERREASAAAR